MKRAVQLPALIVAMLVCGASFLGSQQRLVSERKQAITKQFAELQLPSSDEMSVALLNYRTLGADLGWIALVVNYGEGRVDSAEFSNLMRNAVTVRDLDPSFYRVYEWFPAVYLNQVWPVPFERVEETLAFVRVGYEQFPNDHALPFFTAMSYIGIKNPVGEGPERRYERIIELAELAALRGDDEAAGVLPFYRARLSNDPADTRAAELQFLLTLLPRVQSDRQRRLMQERIRKLSRDKDAAAVQLRTIQEFRLRHQTHGGYMTPELFALVHP